MAREYFKNLPDRTTPLRAERINGLLNGEESIEKIVAGSIEGKNLFDKDNNINYYNWLIYQNGEIGYSNISPIRLIQIPIVGGRTYTISKVAGTRFRASTSDKDVSQFSKTTNNGVNSHITNDTGATITITSTASDKYLYFTIADSETDYNTMKQSTMVEIGSTATDYVPYMKYGYNEDTNMGKLIVEKISGKNLFNGVLTLGAINSNGVDFSDNNSIRSVGYTKVKPNTTYTLNSLDNIKNIVYFYDSNKAFISNIGNNVSLHTFTTPSNCEYLRFCTYVSEGATNINSKFQLELGLQATSYQDFNTTQMGNIVVDDVSCKNLFDKNNINVLNAYFSTTVTTITSNDVNKTIYIKCDANKTYTISKLLSSVFNIGYTTTLPAIGTTVNGIMNSTTGTYDGNTRVSGTITTGNNAQYLVVRAVHTSNDGANSTNIMNSIKIEEGSQATSYTPYKSFDATAYVLWTNPNPTSAFATQLVTLNDVITNYKYYEVIYKRSKDIQRYKSTGRVPTTYGVYMNENIPINRIRTINEVLTNSVRFSDCLSYPTYGQDTTNTTNDYLIPYQIIAYK